MSLTLCLGVAFVAQELVKCLKQSQAIDRSNGRRDYQPILIEKQDERNIVLAGLMHDLGHGIYSHLFDRDFMPRLLK